MSSRDACHWRCIFVNWCRTWSGAWGKTQKSNSTFNGEHRHSGYDDVTPKKLHVYSWLLLLVLLLLVSLQFFRSHSFVRWTEVCTIRNANQYLLHAAFQQGYRIDVLSFVRSFVPSKFNMFTLFDCSCTHHHHHQPPPPSLRTLCSRIMHSLPINATENVISMLLWVLPKLLKTQSGNVSWL